MTFEEVLQVVDQLNDEERQRLHQYLDQQAQSIKAHPLSAEERIQRLNAAMDAMRDGLSQEELDEMTAAMNEDYIEAVDDSLWED